MDNTEVKNNFPTKRIKVPITDIYPNQWNPNKQSDIIFGKLKESIKTYGFLVVPLVREADEGTYEIIDGEHKWRAAAEQGYTELEVDNLGKVDNNTAKTLTLVLNNVRGEDDVLKRAEILKQLNEGQLSLMPFDKKQIASELELLNFDFSQYENAEINEEEGTHIKIPISKMDEVVLMLQKARATTKSQELRVLIERYFDVVRAFKILLKNSRKKIVCHIQKVKYPVTNIGKK